MRTLVYLIFMMYHFLFIPQQRLNDCAPAVMLMVANHYHIDIEADSVALHNRITGGEDRATHFTELVYYLEEWYGIKTEITYNPNVFDSEDPVIVLLRDKAHWVVIYKQTVFDSRKGVIDLSKGSGLEIWLGKHDWVAFRIVEVVDVPE